MINSRNSIYTNILDLTDNQAHGNNLLHKLLLENRLSIHNYKNAEEMSYFEYKRFNGGE